MADPQTTQIDPDDNVNSKPDATDLRRMTRRRTWLILVSLGVVILVTVGLMLVIPLFKSPAQLAADAAPPVAVPITASVEKRKLVTQVVMRGSVVSGPSFSLKPSDALISLGPVITKTPLGNGAHIQVGDVLLEYNGEPLVAMNWSFPAYRDIQPDNRGPDVSQLQATLTNLGYGSGQPGVFDKATQNALENFYATIGYEVPRMPSSNLGTSLGENSEDHGLPTGNTQPETLSGTSGSVGDSNVYFPAAGVAMIPRSEGTLSTLDVAVGKKITVETRLMTLDGGNNVVVGSTTPDRATALKVGEAALLTDSVGSKNYEVTITSVGKELGPVPNLSDGIRVDFNFNDAAIIPSTTGLGSSMKITVTTGGTSDSVLAVPISAIFSEQDGESFIRTIQGSSDHRISVNLGAVVDGWAQISPADGAAITEGDKVIVGSNYGQ